MPRIIATLPFRGDNRDDIIDNPLIDELRINTTTEIDEDDPKGVNSFVKTVLDLVGNKPVIFDFKTRQLRIAQFAWASKTRVKLTHNISVSTPTLVLLKDGEATLNQVINNNGLVLDGPNHRALGKGEAINIPDPSLQVHGFLTKLDLEYAKILNPLLADHDITIWLSFVHHISDFELLAEAMPNIFIATVGAKIEDQKGLEFVKKVYPFMNPKPRLIAACDDLFINIGSRKTKMLAALQTIISADPDAIAASKILTSVFDPRDLEKNPRDPSIGDLAYLIMLEKMGYKTLMLCDDVCRHRKVFARVMEVMEEYLEFTNGISM